MQRYEWRFGYSNLFYWATPSVHGEIEQFVASLTEAYDHAEAAGALREACLRSSGSGQAVLAALHARFPHRVPAKTNAPNAVLDDLIPDCFPAVPA